MAEQLPAEFTMTAEWDAEHEVVGLLPLSCDLTGDRIACALLWQWARHPWEPSWRAKLLDRMEELGKSEEERAWTKDRAPTVPRQRHTRTSTARFLKLLWRPLLVSHFGNFESKYST